MNGTELRVVAAERTNLLVALMQMPVLETLHAIEISANATFHRLYTDVVTDLASEII